MAVARRITEAEYRELAFDPDETWELWDGVPRAKPTMTIRHGGTSGWLGVLLQNQLDPSHYLVSFNHAKARVSARNYFVPDVAVIPRAYQLGGENDPRALDAYDQPLPLVVEVWSPSTGGYDFETKLRGYRERGDEEIWYVHPYERTIAVWRRQPDGSYLEARYRGGVVEVASLPGVRIDLDALFDRRRPNA